MGKSNRYIEEMNPVVCEVAYDYTKGNYAKVNMGQSGVIIVFKQYFYYDYIRIFSGDSSVFTGIVTDVYAWSVFPYIYNHVEDKWLSNRNRLSIKHDWSKPLYMQIGDCKFEIKPSFSGVYEIWKREYCELSNGKYTKKIIIDVYDHITTWE